MAPGDVGMCEHLAGDLLADLGYDLSGARPSLRALSQLVPHNMTVRTRRSRGVAARPRERGSPGWSRHGSERRQKLVSDHLVQGEATPGFEIGVRIDQTLTETRRDHGRASSRPWAWST